MFEHLHPIWPALLLDTLLGDPERLPHPVRGFGKAIYWLEKRFNRGQHRKRNGTLVAAGLIAACTGTTALLLHWLTPFGSLHYWSVVVVAWLCIANRNLIQEALMVEFTLRKKGLEAGRKRLSRIVGRDTSGLSEQQIRTATLETLSENLSDGVIAPLFYFFLGGIPLMMGYKMVNTLDSMIGYKNERYRDFGWFAARTDDAANLIPARLTALLMLLVSLQPHKLLRVFKQGKNHSSPNSGYPEAALAEILHCRFGGPNSYHGVLVEKPWIGSNSRPVKTKDIVLACVVNAAVTGLFCYICTHLS